MRLRSRLGLIAIVVSVCAATAAAQGYNSFRQFTTSTVSTDSAIQQNRTILYHQLSWNGNEGTCAVSADSSPDGINWTIGGIIPTTICTTSPGIVSITSGVSANFIRINVSTLASGTVNVVYTGWSLGASTNNPAVSNNTYAVDGIINTTTNAILALPNLVNGGNIIFRPTSPQLLTANMFGNTATLPGATYVGISTTGCTANTFGSGVSVTEFLIVNDPVLDVSFSSQVTNVTPGTGYCPVILASPNSVFPGATTFQIAWCTGAGCGATLSNFQIGSTAAVHTSSSYGPFSTAPLAFDVPVSAGPSVFPANTAGLIVSNIHLSLGNQAFSTSVPQVTGTYSNIFGDTGSAVKVIASQSIPDSIPQLGKPWGALLSGGAGSSGHSQTVSLGLFDGCNVASGAGNLVSIGPIKAFPPMSATFDQVAVLNPGIYASPSTWAPNTLYWGSTATCVGERIVIFAVGTEAVLRATNVGISSATQPTWQNAGVCPVLQVGNTCSDNTVTWNIEALWKARGPSVSYTVGGRPTNPGATCSGCGTIYDSTTSMLWMLDLGASAAPTGTTCTSGTTASSALFSAAAGSGNLLPYVGDVVQDTAGGGTCAWIAIGTFNSLINPMYGVYSADTATPNQTGGGAGLKQASGGGAAATPYLASLKLNTAAAAVGVSGSGIRSDWAGCTDTSQVFTGNNIKGTCDANQTGSITTVTGAGAGATITANMVAPTDGGACLTNILSIASCNPAINASPTFFTAVWVTPNGPGPAGVELGVAAATFTNGHAVAGTAPINPPMNAIGYLISVGLGASFSANTLIQIPDGVNFICGKYVTLLPYGRICDAASGWTANNLLANPPQIAGLNFDKMLNESHDPSEMGFTLGGPMLLPAWPGGCYDTTLNNLFIEMAPTTTLYEGNAWGIVNHGCEESSQPDAVLVADALGGAYYGAGTACQNSNVGYIHTVGTQTDYTIPVLLETCLSFHSERDVSVGAQQGTPWLSRSGVMLETDYASSAGLLSMAEIHSPTCEASVECVTIDNSSAVVVNHQGRSSIGQRRSAVWGTHFDQYATAVNCQLCWNANVGQNIQDDANTPYQNGTTQSPTAPTAHYIRDIATTGGVGGVGPASNKGFLANSDPSGLQQAPGPVTGKRFTVDTATTLVVGDFNITAGPSWGSAAALTVTNATSKDQSFQVTITEGGISQAANPTIVLTFHDGTFTTVPNYTCNLDSSTTDVIADVLTHSIATALTITYAATPTTNKIVVINCVGTGT